MVYYDLFNAIIYLYPMPTPTLVKNLLKNLLLMLIMLSFSACTLPFHFLNYTPWNTPRYSYSRPPKEPLAFNDPLKVVSYNIKHSKRISDAIKLLQTDPNLAHADILLLQEMTPQAVQIIAEGLELNYIFYPAVLHPILNANFGNAVLSKWPITYDQNVIFPSVKEKSRHRIAVAARLNIDGRKVLVYSLHMGIFMKPFQRAERVQGILDKLPDDIDYGIVAGDFNTFTKKNQDEIIHTFTQAGFTYATESVDWTFRHWYILYQKARLDHIFVKGFQTLNAGSVHASTPSDHLPVWANLSFQ